MTPGHWGAATAQMGHEDLDRLLAQGWEPISATTLVGRHPMTGEPQIMHVFHLRKWIARELVNLGPLEGVDGAGPVQ